MLLNFSYTMRTGVANMLPRNHSPRHYGLSYILIKKISKEQHGDDFEVSLDEMKEFFNDGCKIIDEFLKRKGSHFKKKDTELVGIEMNLNYGLPKDMKFVGFMDVVLHDKKTGRMKVIDIKSSNHMCLFSISGRSKLPPRAATMLAIVHSATLLLYQCLG